MKETASKVQNYIKSGEESKETARKVKKCPTVAAISDYEKILVIRVGVVSNTDVLRIKCADKFSVIKDDKEIKEVPAEEDIKFEKNNKSVSIKDKSGNVISEYPMVKGTAVLLKCGNRDATFTVYDVTLNKGSFWAKNLDRSYRGSLEVLVETGLTLVNIINMEEYLYSVVPSEIGASSGGLEALKAQSVIARSYAYDKVLNRKHTNYAVCSDVHCQAYNGVESEYKTTTKAIDATKGEVLFYQDRVVNTFFFSNCGGRTRNVEDTWKGNPDPSLRGVPDYDVLKDNQEYSEWPLSPEKLDKWIKLEPDAFCQNEGEYRWFKIIESPEEAIIAGRDLNGYVTEVRIKDKILSADKYRVILTGVRSNFFKLEKNFLFGCGWGHGVGLCQGGAIGMAKKGYDYKEILKHYYSGTEVKKIY